MKYTIAAIALIAISLCAIPAEANNKKIKVIAAGNAGTDMQVRITTVDARTVTGPVTETFTVTLAAADVVNPSTKAAAIVAAINATAVSVTAAVDATDKSIVVITSGAGRTISLVDVRPLKSGERDMLAALGPADGENLNAAVVLGFDLEGTGSVNAGFATIEIGGVPFTVSTGSGEAASDVLLALEILIDSAYTTSIAGNDLSIFGSIIGKDYSAFVSDAVGPGSLGFSYGFSVQSFPQPIPEPTTLALLAAAALGGMAIRGRFRPRYESRQEERE